MELKKPDIPRADQPPVLGFISLAFFFLAPLVAWGVKAAAGSDEFGGMGAVIPAMLLGGIVWLVGLVAGIASLYRSERPRWPAITSLVLSGGAVVGLLVLSIVYAP